MKRYTQAGPHTNCRKVKRQFRVLKGFGGHIHFGGMSEEEARPQPISERVAIEKLHDVDGIPAFVADELDRRRLAPFGLDAIPTEAPPTFSCPVCGLSVISRRGKMYCGEKCAHVAARKRFAALDAAAAKLR